MKGLIARLAKVVLIWMTFLTTTSFADEQNVTVLVHPSVSTVQLTDAQLRKIFSMRQTVWPNGTPIVVFVRGPQTPAHSILCKEVLKMFPYQVERIWNKLAYSGLGDKPTEVESESEMLNKLSSTPGAIGYALEAHQADGLKHVTVIGD
ncbi:substrate-binding domain-containing protein [Aliiglaciecola sp. LCG003]|uniref:substrate-binding domain-containing protein n=1 Tax=Aliiglaciecola sp. LCG003 TaxID=3053655 RepID=UPI00257405C8|nr:substrate-binding domain-containing protein [Aliiglaciecola sp. LCG003]WJG09517.1 substrate-binding domain-containing protein [Aliiglaciecola sp. LCG003]